MMRSAVAFATRVLPLAPPLSALLTTDTMAADSDLPPGTQVVNVTVAIARGEIKPQGPVAKILRLVPLTKPVFPRYKALLEKNITELGELVTAENGKVRSEARGFADRESTAG